MCDVNLTDYLVKMTGIMHVFILYIEQINMHITATEFQE
tara:strand:- start:54162 stop:54278 length:117 start_codon:yes stop_codon:yes gene_type:complete